jgi:hypothetical protein
MTLKLILVTLLPGVAILGMAIAVGEIDCLRNLGPCVHAFVEGR